jgi:hypothetical protein
MTRNGVWKKPHDAGEMIAFGQERVERSILGGDEPIDRTRDVVNQLSHRGSDSVE